ncbi:unnamed protein product, partial [Laminaria digitata]
MSDLVPCIVASAVGAGTVLVIDAAIRLDDEGGFLVIFEQPRSPELWCPSVPEFRVYLRLRYIHSCRVSRCMGPLLIEGSPPAPERKVISWRWAVMTFFVRACSRALVRARQRTSEVGPRHKLQWAADTRMVQAGRQLDFAVRLQAVFGVMVVWAGLLQWQLVFDYKLNERLCLQEEDKRLFRQELFCEAMLFQERQLRDRRDRLSQRYLQRKLQQQLSERREQHVERHGRQKQQQQLQQQQQQQTQQQHHQRWQQHQQLQRWAQHQQQEQQQQQQQQHAEELEMVLRDVTMDLREAEDNAAFLRRTVQGLTARVDRLEHGNGIAAENALNASSRYTRQLSGMEDEVGNLRRTVDQMLQV